ncbi:hypothetical protein Q9L58_010445 [Maublancomyces gigas]|uniref:Uncharacterized protein n=1 Tax=Discina gigas TaxID=1032678 RepID=A0ABR3G4H3_9PEZI
MSKSTKPPSTPRFASRTLRAVTSASGIGSGSSSRPFFKGGTASFKKHGDRVKAEGKAEGSARKVSKTFQDASRAITSGEDLPPVPFASLPEPISPLPDSNVSVSPASSLSPTPPPPLPTPASSAIESDYSRSRKRGVDRIVGPANSLLKHWAELMKK